MAPAINAWEFSWPEGGDKDVRSEYCCSITVSDGSNAGLGTPLQVRGRSEEVVGKGVGWEGEMDAAASELVR